MLGPLIASLATALVRIWERDFANADDTEAAPPATPPGPALESKQQTPEVLPPRPNVA